MGQLEEIIIRKVLNEGPVNFASFMELALYHPEYGYYNKPGKKIGRQGDFYTSGHVSHLFGQALARQLIQMGSFLGWEGLALVEYGAGEGFLAKDILESFAKERPELQGGVTYYICERSHYMREEQRSLLQPFLSQVRWIDDLAAVNGGKPVKGIVFSNELIDAFPVHRVKLVDGELKEIYVDYRDGELVEILGPLSHPQLAEYFPFLGFQLEEGQEAEINLRALDWLSHIGRYLFCGFVLTVDYGYEVRELAHPLRRAGTVMCYRQHRADAEPLKDVGLKDITSHVNFSALMKYGEQYGFKTTGFTNQMKFLAGLGVGKALEDPDLSPWEKQRMALALKELLMPDRMGERFRVLIQQKGLDEIPDLLGLKGFSVM